MAAFRPEEGITSSPPSPGAFANVLLPLSSFAGRTREVRGRGGRPPQARRTARGID